MPNWAAAPPNASGGVAAGSHGVALPLPRRGMRPLHPAGMQTVEREGGAVALLPLACISHSCAFCMMLFNRL